MFNGVGHKDASEILKTAFNLLERNLPFSGIQPPARIYG